MGIFRIFLAISVLTGHLRGKSILGLRFLYGDLAVQCFFMISGFYMALVLHEKYNQPGSYFTFIQQRFLRLYPAYLGITALMALIMGSAVWLGGQPAGFLVFWLTWGKHLAFSTWTVLGLSNLLIFGQDDLVYLGVDPQTGLLYLTAHGFQEKIGAWAAAINSPAWSLGVELCFYLLAPFLVRRSVALQLAVLGLSLGARVFLQDVLGVPREPFIYRFFPLQLCFFLAGSLAYRIYRNHQPRLLQLKKDFPWISWLFLFLVAIYSRLPGAHSLYLVFIPLVFLMIPFLFATTQKNPRDRLIGELSYPFYLSHPLVLFIFERTLEPHVPRAIFGTICLAAVLIFSYLFYRFVESRMDAYRESLFRRRWPRLKAAAALTHAPPPDLNLLHPAKPIPPAES